MFSAVSSTARWWLIGLLVVWAILLFGGYAIGKPTNDASNRIPTLGRLGSSFVLVLAAWSWAWFGRNSELKLPVLLMALGMTLGFIGDLFMARIIPFNPHVIGGMGSFGLGHIAYIAGMLMWANSLNLNNAQTRWIAWLVWMIIGVVAWYLVVWRGQQPTIMHKIALPYALLLASTVGVAMGLALTTGNLWLLVLGAALFLTSDLILATQIFNGANWRGLGDVVWLTYGPGQMLIVYSIGLLLAARLKT